MLKKILVSGLLVAIIGAIFYSNRPQAPTVRVHIASAELTESTVSNTRAGTVMACQRSRLALSVGGQIAAIFVREGDKVKSGTQLLALWNQDLKAQLNATTAGYRALEFEKNGLCIQATADFKEASRHKNLLKQKLVSEETSDLSSTRANLSEAACAAANARLQQAKAVIAQAQASLDKTYLIAPFDGTVAEVTGEVGEFTTPSPPGVATPPAIDLITDECHYIKAPIDEVDAGKLAIGMPVRVSLDAFRGQNYLGRVRRISPYVQDYAKQARTVEIEVEFSPQSLPRLLAGYSVDVEIILASSAAGMRVPSDALLNDSSLLVLNPDDIIEQRKVTLGLSNWQFTQITDGLKQGERVILLANNSALKPGDSATAE